MLRKVQSTQGGQQGSWASLGKPSCSEVCRCGRNTQTFLPGLVREVTIDDPTWAELGTFSSGFLVDWNV